MAWKPRRHWKPRHGLAVQVALALVVSGRAFVPRAPRLRSQESSTFTGHALSRGRSALHRIAADAIPDAADVGGMVFGVRVPPGAIAGDELEFVGPDQIRRKATIPEGYEEGARFKVGSGGLNILYVDGEMNLESLPEACSIDQPELCAGSGENALVDRLNAMLEAGLGTGLLVAAAVISLILANCCGTSSKWLGIWAMRAGPRIGAHALTLRDWVNEGLMTLFFFTVGLEIKKEMVEGSLASFNKAILPCIAALGGMVVPVLVYVAVNTVLPGGALTGASVPMATDIAFAMGVYQAFRRRMPPAASSFLLALATVDDLGAIVVIAVVFAGSIAPRFLAAGAFSLAAAAIYGSGNLENTRGFLLPGILLWYCLLRGGVNADVAGVLTAFCIPLRSKSGALLVERLINSWSAISALVILPLFGLANCAVPLELAGSGSAKQLAIPIGVGLGLILGKPLGIFGASYAAVKAGVSPMPPGMTKRHLAIVGMLGAIGFTMCLFLIENSLSGPAARLSKMAVFAASFIGAGVSAFFMSRQPQRKAVVAGGMALA